jgi:hypothetical protein
MGGGRSGGVEQFGIAAVPFLGVTEILDLLGLISTIVHIIPKVFGVVVVKIGVQVPVLVSLG